MTKLKVSMGKMLTKSNVFMVGGSLRVLWLPPPLKLVAMI
jgi:hypothetical protein